MPNLYGGYCLNCGANLPVSGTESLCPHCQTPAPEMKSPGASLLGALGQSASAEQIVGIMEKHSKDAVEIEIKALAKCCAVLARQVSVLQADLLREVSLRTRLEKDLSGQKRYGL